MIKLTTFKSKIQPAVIKWLNAHPEKRDKIRIELGLSKSWMVKLCKGGIEDAGVRKMEYVYTKYMKKKIQ